MSWLHTHTSYDDPNDNHTHDHTAATSSHNRNPLERHKTNAKEEESVLETVQSAGEVIKRLEEDRTRGNFLLADEAIFQELEKEAERSHWM